MCMWFYINRINYSATLLICPVTMYVFMCACVACLIRSTLSIVRPLDLFYKLFLIDPLKRVSVKLCPFVDGGRMHRDFQKYLSSDGLGIDYSKLKDYDTASAMMKNLAREHPKAIQDLEQAISSLDKPAIKEALKTAKRVGVGYKNPQVIEAAQAALK